MAILKSESFLQKAKSVREWRWLKQAEQQRIMKDINQKRTEAVFQSSVDQPSAIKDVSSISF